MQLRHTTTWYNPFEVDGRYLKNIHFYTPAGIKMSTERGWFGNNNESNGMILPFDVIYKRAPINFNKVKGAFLVKVKSDRWESKLKHSELYIPYDPKEWEISERRSTDPTHMYIYTIYKWVPYNVTFQVLETIEREEAIEYENDLLGLCELLKGGSYSIHANRESILKEMKRLSDKWIV